MKPLWIAIAVITLGVVCLILLGAASLLLYGSMITTDEYNKVASANFSAACINVIRDHEQKRIRLFAVTQTTPTITDVDGWSVEVVSNPEIIIHHRKFAGSYHNHHNLLVLNAAAVHLLEGNHPLGLYLIRTLAEIDPTLEWSSPTLGNRTILTILKGVEANDGSMQDFLDHQMDQWKWRNKRYGTPTQAR